MKISLPEYIKNAIKKLEEKGYEAYCVGGGIRDLLLGLTPSDYDITTNAPPQAVTDIFEKTVPTGIKHGTVTVITSKGNIEITTYRTEKGYTDSRHPDEVSFVGNLNDDLIRRDFTVNAVAYNGKEIRFVRFGKSDLENKIIRAVGEPITRFSEDALRIMRCFRFASQLEFNIEENTLHSALSLLPTLENISKERIANELIKMLLGKNPTAANPFFENSGLLFAGLGCGKLPKQLDNLPLNPHTRLAAAIYILGGSPEEICTQLKMSNKLKRDTNSVYDILCKPFSINKSSLKILLGSVEEEILRDSILSRSILFNEDNSNALEILEDILKNCEPYRICDLSIGGDELKSLGIPQRKIGKILNKLLDAVIEEPSLNTEKSLIELVNNMK